MVVGGGGGGGVIAQQHWGNCGNMLALQLGLAPDALLRLWRVHFASPADEERG